MKKFTEVYLRNNSLDLDETQMLVIIAEFERVVQERVNSLDQALRDLLQFVCLSSFVSIRDKSLHDQEFAWVSINEAHRSIDLAASMKRLTWITMSYDSLQQFKIKSNSCSLFFSLLCSAL